MGMAAQYLGRFTKTRISLFWIIIIRHIIPHQNAEIVPYLFMYALKIYLKALAQEGVRKLKIGFF